MDGHKFDKLLEDIAYLRGRFDTVIPEIQRSSENINAILLLHKEKIDNINKDIITFKAKVGVFGSIAGFIGAIITTIIINLINKKLF